MAVSDPSPNICRWDVVWMHRHEGFFGRQQISAQGDAANHQRASISYLSVEMANAEHIALECQIIGRDNGLGIAASRAPVWFVPRELAQRANAPAFTCYTDPASHTCRRISCSRKCGYGEFGQHLGPFPWLSVSLSAIVQPTACPGDQPLPFSMMPGANMFMSALTAPRNTRGEKVETRPALQYEESRESLTEAVGAGVRGVGTFLRIVLPLCSTSLI